MEDWHIADGAAQCQSTQGDRNIHLLTHQIKAGDATFKMSVRITEAQRGQRPSGAGFRIGIRSDINEYRSNCFAKSGINCGSTRNELILGERRKEMKQREQGTTTLRLCGILRGGRCELELTALDTSGSELAKLTADLSVSSIVGNVALVSNFDPSTKGRDGSQYAFRDWSVGGDAFEVAPAQKFGPILWSMYTLSDSRSDERFVLKMSALLAPLGEQDNHAVELQVERGGQWVSVGEAQADADSWTATFRVPDWDATTATRYKLVYRQSHTDGDVSVAERAGIIRANPAGRPLRMAALTCQNDYAFPYEPVANNLLLLDPDLLYFSGDQIYENHGGYGLIRHPAERAILNYLRKFYQFGWAFGDAMRDRPTLCIPDDHDVFQGNLWGEGGAKMEGRRISSSGGYREPARMVNAVHKSCVGHHPDFFDPTPCKQRISVYYGDMVYGDVSFAIVADRQFKSGPEEVDTGPGRADHITSPEVESEQLDKPGLELLGERQEQFLEHWASDWRGHKMKVLLSQTVFAGVATHHGSYSGFLYGDLDSGGWPQTPRNRAIRIVREAMPLHINGDQHLTSLVQYGVEKQRDGCWSFCPPAIAVGYPRWWRPDEVDMPHENRPKHGLSNTGEYVDAFGNYVYVYAVGNPDVGDKRNRYELAHQKGSGFGMVTIDTKEKAYKCESFRFLADVRNDKPGNLFPGWPVTILQQENGGRNVIG